MRRVPPPRAQARVMTEQQAQAWWFGDGRFTFVAPLAQAPTLGTPVVVSTPDGRSLLGQVGHAVLAEGPDRDVPDASTMQVLGRGTLQAVLDGGGAVTGQPFVGAHVATASQQT